MSGVNAGPGSDWLPQSVAGLGVDDLAEPLTAVSFWFAIVLPAVYLPLLVAGIESASGLATVIGLVGLHVAALIGGRTHAAETDR